MRTSQKPTSNAKPSKPTPSKFMSHKQSSPALGENIYPRESNPSTFKSTIRNTTSLEDCSLAYEACDSKPSLDNFSSCYSKIGKPVVTAGAYGQRDIQSVGFRSSDKFGEKKYKTGGANPGNSTAQVPRQSKPQFFQPVQKILEQAEFSSD